MSKERYALTFDEMTRARYFFHKHADEYITLEFQMRTILSEMGQYPPSSEIQFCLEQFDMKMNFNNFCNYCSYLKKKYSKPEPKDVDTLRAFVALGGVGDRSGDIITDDLRSTCKHFQLTIDIDSMLRDVDEDGSGAIDYSEFAAMWQANHDDEEEGSVDKNEGGTAMLGARKGSMKAEEPTLDEDDNLVVVKGFLFPLQRKQTMQNEMAARDQAMMKRKMSRKSIVKLPTLGGSMRMKNEMSGITGSSTKNLDIGEHVQVEEEELPSLAGGGLKPVPPQHQQQRQAVPSFIPPSPVILDFRGSYSSRKRNNKKDGGSSSSYSPRKPHTSRAPSKRSRLY